MTNSKRIFAFFSIIFILGFSGIFFSSCKVKSMEGMIIFTRSDGKMQETNYETGNFWRYIPQAQIASIDPGIPGGALKVLTGDFFSACSPQISYDGKFLIFAAQQKENDTWEIWEMNLRNKKIRQVTSCFENCIDPYYLPDGRLVFSRLSVDDTLKAGHTLYTVNLDGSDLKRITFGPNAYLASSVLNDGRILTISRQLFPYPGNSSFMVIRPDGTKAELFYKGIDGNALFSRARENEDGKIVFIESDKKNQAGGNVISVSYNNPLNTRQDLTASISGDFKSVYPMPSGRMLISFRPSETDRYALYEFDPEKKSVVKSLYSNSEYDIIEAVLVRKYDRPKKLPSEVDKGVKSGLILCQDINISDNLSNYASVPWRVSQIEVVGLDSSLGVVQAEPDGSFYLKVIADKPFQIRTLDENGRVTGKSCDWIWLRPNERRGCTGCHEAYGQVPDNRVPLAVRNPPVSIPVHISKVKEKQVSLE